ENATARCDGPPKSLLIKTVPRRILHQRKVPIADIVTMNFGGDGHNFPVIGSKCESALTHFPCPFGFSLGDQQSSQAHERYWFIVDVTLQLVQGFRGRHRISLSCWLR